MSTEALTKPSADDCEGTAWPVCPHCGHPEGEWHRSTLDRDEDQDIFSCGSCGKDYVVTIHISVDFDTRPVEPKGKGERG